MKFARRELARVSTATESKHARPKFPLDNGLSLRRTVAVRWSHRYHPGTFNGLALSPTSSLPPMPRQVASNQPRSYLRPC